MSVLTLNLFFSRRLLSFSLSPLPSTDQFCMYTLFGFSFSLLIAPPPPILISFFPSKIDFFVHMTFSRRKMVSLSPGKASGDRAAQTGHEASYGRWTIGDSFVSDELSTVNSVRKEAEVGMKSGISAELPCRQGRQCYAH